METFVLFIWHKWEIHMKIAECVYCHRMDECVGCAWSERQQFEQIITLMVVLCVALP